MVGMAVSSVEGHQVGLRQAARTWNAQSCILAYRYAADSCLMPFFPDPARARADSAFLDDLNLAIFDRLQAIDVAALSTLPASDTGAMTRLDDERVTRRQTEPIILEAGTSPRLVGWAVDPVAQRPAGGVLIRIDDGPPIWGAIDRPSPAVAEGEETADYGQSGFAIQVPADALPPGDHVITMQAVTHDRQAVFETSRRGQSVLVRVE